MSEESLRTSMDSRRPMCILPIGAVPKDARQLERELLHNASVDEERYRFFI